MSFPRFASIFAAFVLSLGCAAAAQQLSTVHKPPAPVDNDFVQKEFGSSCALVGIPPVIADMDGDGVDDIVIPARCTNPMMDQAENGFQVIDPYDGYFGYGNPKITTQFASEDPERRGYALLVIHGQGEHEWRSATPKAKFMIINLPYKELQIKKWVQKKRQTFGIYVEETGGDKMTSVVFWDGKKYRYEPLGSTLE